MNNYKKVVLMQKPALTEQRNHNTMNIDLMNAYEIAKTINEEDKKVAFAIEKELQPISEGIELIAQAFQKGGRLGYFGAGTSGRLCVLDASECPPTFSTPRDMVQGFIAGGDGALRYSIENSEDNAEFGLADLTTFNPTPNDIIVSVSASGNPAYVLSVLEHAQKLGCKTIGISSNPDAKLKQYSDIFINPLVGAEVVTGSSRMKSGTAQKLVLNMLTTGAMIRIGKTYENLMVDVSVSNKKLHDRACRIIVDISKVSYDEAQEYLEKSAKKVKVACVMAIKKCSKEQAEQLLQNNSGILRKVI